MASIIVFLDFQKCFSASLIPLWSFQILTFSENANKHVPLESIKAHFYNFDDTKVPKPISFFKRCICSKNLQITFKFSEPQCVLNLTCFSCHKRCFMYVGIRKYRLITQNFLLLSLTLSNTYFMFQHLIRINPCTF